MERFYLEEPSIGRKEAAIDYIHEHIEYNSRINGCGGLDNYLKESSYENWLKFIDDLNSSEGASKYGWVPGKTYFLIRDNDNKIVGMINIRLRLNEQLKKAGGHIGYGIRPTERRKGYNKINLYLGLQVCNQYGIEEVFLYANKDNIASWKTMEALGGVLVEECLVKGVLQKKYSISVSESLEKYKDVYAKKLVRK